MANPIVKVELDLDSNKIDSGLKKVAAGATKSGLDIGTKLVAGIASAIAVGATIRKAINSAIIQQNAINDLNRSLAASGQYTKQASQDFQDYASSLQKVSTFGDEVILQNAALIQSLGKLDQQGLKRATQASLDLSAALGIDLRSASQLVGKAAAGEVGSFSRYGLIIKKGSDNAETFANALGKLETAFGGAAASKLNTFEGQLKKAENAFGDILEGFGALITNSPTLLALFKVLSEQLGNFADYALKLGSRDIFSIDAIVLFGRALNYFIVAPLELIYNAAKVVFNFITTTAAAFVGVAGYAAGKLGELFDKVGINPELAQNLKDFAETSQQVFDENQDALIDSAKNIFDGSIFGKGEEFLSNLKGNLEKAKAEIEASGIKNVLQENVAVQGPSFADSFIAGFSQAEITLKNFAEKTMAFGAQIRSSLKSGIANAAGQSFAAFGQALASGQNALDAFAKAFVSSIGQIAIQQGTAFILQGLGYLFVPGFQSIGAGLIAAGAALATFGGVLGAVAGGGKGASAAAGGGGGGVSGPSEVSAGFGLASQGERQEPETRVVVNIQGSVLDSDETGLRIANILKEASLNNNVQASVFA